MTRWQRRIGRRLNLIVAVVCVLVVAGIWLTTLQRMGFERRQAVQAAHHANSNLAIAFEQQVVRTLRAAEQVAAFVREEYTQHGENLDLESLVRRGAIRETLFTIISVVNESGDVVASSQGEIRANYVDRPFFVAQINNPDDTLYVNAPVIGRVSGEVRVPMSLRITNPDGSFGGVVVLSVEPAAFTEFYSQADLGGQGLLELTAHDGMVLGRKVGPRIADSKGVPSLTALVGRDGPPADSFFDTGRAIDGVARLVSYRRLAEYPLTVTVGTAHADVLAPVVQRRTVYLSVAGLASAGLLLFAAVAMWLLARQRQADEALRTSEALYRATFHQAATGIAHIAPDGRILGTNEKFRDMLGYSAEALQSQSIVDLSEPESRDSVRQFLQHCVDTPSSGFSPEIEKPYRRKDGTILWVCEALGVVRDSAGRPDFLVAVTQDITARKELEARLLHDAMHDALTGLPNRSMFHERLNQVLAAARRHGRKVAVLYLDLDGFKQVNDTHGHAVGDVLLQQVAGRLRRNVRAEDLVARFSGDEFGVVLESVSAADDARVVGDKLVHVLSMPFEIDGITARISASVGVSVFPDDGDDSRSLIIRADATMYESKRQRYERMQHPLGAG